MPGTDTSARQLVTSPPKACRAISSSDFFQTCMAQFVRQEGKLRQARISGSTDHGLAWSEGVRCKSCASESRLEFGAEMIVHFPGLEGLDKPSAWVFPKLLVCMDCGFTEFAIPETELASLAIGMRKIEASRRQKSAEDVTTRDPRFRSNGSDPRGGDSEVTG